MGSIHGPIRVCQLKFLALIFLMALSCQSKQIVENLEIQIKTEKKGIRVYDDQGQFLGKSPVMISKKLKIRDLGGGIRRYFLDQKELHPGGSWRLNLKMFSQGVKIHVSILVPFDPNQLRQTVWARP